MKIRIIALYEAGEQPHNFSITLPSGKRVTLDAHAALADVDVDEFKKTANRKRGLSGAHAAPGDVV